jgi:hypothetical protein
MEPATHEVTQLPKAWSAGDQEALEKLTPLVYEELHRAAHRYMAQERPGHLLQTTALVNEVYLRLVDIRVTWQGSRSFSCRLCAADAARADGFRSLPRLPEEGRGFAPCGFG